MTFHNKPDPPADLWIRVTLAVLGILMSGFALGMAFGMQFLKTLPPN